MEMAKGSLVWIVAGPLKGKIATVEAISGNRVTVRGAFGVSSFSLNQVEAI